MAPAGKSSSDDDDDDESSSVDGNFAWGRPTLRLNFAGRQVGNKKLDAINVKQRGSSTAAKSPPSSVPVKLPTVPSTTADTINIKSEEGRPSATTLKVPSSGLHGTRKRSRKEVLASISLNTRKKAMPPIPSFKSDTELRILEQAFFDDEDGDDCKKGEQGMDVVVGSNKDTANKDTTAAPVVEEKGFALLILSSDEEKEDSDDENWLSITSRAFPTKGRPTKGTTMNSLTPSTATKGNARNRVSSMSQQREQGKLDSTASGKEQRKVPGKADGEGRTTTMVVLTPPTADVHAEQQNHPTPRGTVSSSLERNSLVYQGGGGETSIEAENPKTSSDKHGTPPATMQEEGPSSRTRKGNDNRIDNMDVGCEGTDSSKQPHVQPTSPSHNSSEPLSDHFEGTSRPEVFCSEKLEQPPVLEIASTTKALPYPSIEMDVDRLFVRSDIALVTMNGFCRTLEQQRGIKLDKKTAKAVKKRVLDLINGVVHPLPMTAPPKTGLSITSTTEIARASFKDLHTDVVAPMPAPTKKDGAPHQHQRPQKDPETKTSFRTLPNPKKEKSGDQKDSRTRREGESLELQVKTQCVEETSKVAISVDAEADPEADSRNGIVIADTKSDVQPAAATVPAIPPLKKSSNRIIAKRKLPKSKQGSDAPADSRPLPRDQRTEEPDMVEQAKAKPKPRAKRGRQRKVAAETCGDEPREYPICINKAPAAPAVTRGPQKRGRKNACALCTTCPCQRGHNGRDDGTTTHIDMKESFARSDAAIERALIRRILKLEKSAESMQEQTELVRRSLKKHRRDVWKRAERQMSLRDPTSTRMFMSTNSAGGGTSDSWFLPDSEIFEAQQMESISVRREIVKTAKERVFDNPPSKYLDCLKS
jgi:hypothetical protein